MVLINLQKALKVFQLLRPPLHREKINDLNEQESLTITRLSHHLDELPQSRDETIVADAKQRTTRNVAHAGRLNDQHSGPPFRKASIPIEVLLRHKTVVRRPPRH